MKNKFKIGDRVVHEHKRRINETGRVIKIYSSSNNDRGVYVVKTDITGEIKHYYSYELKLIEDFHCLKLYNVLTTSGKEYLVIALNMEKVIQKIGEEPRIIEVIAASNKFAVPNTKNLIIA